MRLHKPHTKTKGRTLSKNSDYNIPHGNVNNLNSSHLWINQYLNYYQPHNKREINQDGNWKIYDTPAWKNKKEGELREDISKKYPLFAISAVMFKFSAAVQPRPMILDIDNYLPAMHMRFGTSDKNEATFFSCRFLCSNEFWTSQNRSMDHNHQPRYCIQLY